MTPELFTAEFFSENLPDYMEEELHEIFSELNGQHTRQEAEETQSSSDCAQIDLGTQWSDMYNMNCIVKSIHRCCHNVLCMICIKFAVSKCGGFKSIVMLS